MLTKLGRYRTIHPVLYRWMYHIVPKNGELIGGPIWGPIWDRFEDRYYCIRNFFIISGLISGIVSCIVLGIGYCIVSYRSMTQHLVGQYVSPKSDLYYKTRRIRTKKRPGWPIFFKEKLCLVKLLYLCQCFRIRDVQK